MWPHSRYHIPGCFWSSAALPRYSIVILQKSLTECAEHPTVVWHVVLWLLLKTSWRRLQCLQVKDIAEMVPLLLHPSRFLHGRLHGSHSSQPILIRAGPGTGKLLDSKRKSNTGSNVWVSSLTLRKMALIHCASILYNDAVYQYIVLLCQIVNKVKISENDWTNGYIGRNLTQKKRITTDDLTARGNSLTGRTFRIGSFPAP